MKLLVVEDNTKMALLLQCALQEEGHLADILENGLNAIERARAIGYDVIILDWMLPGADGIEVCRVLRQRGCNTPILMLNGALESFEQ